MDDIMTAVHDLLTGKQTDAVTVHKKLKVAMDSGYFTLRKRLSKDQVLALSEINKLMATWDGSDSQKAFVQYYYNQLGRDTIDIFDHHIADVENPAQFSSMIAFMIGAGIPGKDLDEFENWLEEEQKDGDGYRLVTPTKNLYGLVIVEAAKPRVWKCSFFGSKPLVNEMKKIFGTK